MKKLMIMGLLVAGVASYMQAADLSKADALLLQIAEFGDAQGVKYLIDNEGAHVDVRDFSSSKLGRTPLMYACQMKHFDVVKVLIERGADVNMEDVNGITPLMLAHGEEAVRLLLARGALVNHVACYGITPLIEAIHWADLPVVKLLIAAGASPFLDVGKLKNYDFSQARKEVIEYILGFYDRRAVLCALKAHYEILPEADRVGSFEDFPPDVTWMVLKPLLAATELK